MSCLTNPQQSSADASSLRRMRNRSLNATNMIGSVMAQIERTTQRVGRWRNSDQKQRWVAASLPQIEAKCDAYVASNTWPCCKPG